MSVAGETITWSCERCVQRGEIEIDHEASFVAVQQLVAKDHKGASPDCRSKAMRFRMYDPERQLSAVKR